MLLQNVGDPIPFLQAALRRAPGNGVALALYEQALEARGDTEALAKLHADELVAPLVEPGDYVRRVFRLLAVGRPADAWATAESGLALAPYNAELRFNGVLALLRLGRESDALDHLGSIDENAGAVFAQAIQMRAALLARRGDVPGAARAIGAWVNASQNDANAIVSGAQWLAGNGGRAEARALLTKYAERDRRIATELAKMLIDDGNLEAAGAVAERALL
jgi:thioredoxin-like negative regulator of GroEL